MKKLLALAIVGAFLALTTGCPPATTKSSGPASVTPPAPATSPPKTIDTEKPPKTTDTEKPPKAAATTHDGKFVKLADGKLTMNDKDGKAMPAHDVTKDVKITLDGKDAKVEDLKADMAITVTMDGDKVTKVDAKTK